MVRVKREGKREPGVRRQRTGKGRSKERAKRHETKRERDSTKAPEACPPVHAQEERTQTNTHGALDLQSAPKPQPTTEKENERPVAERRIEKGEGGREG